MKTTPPVDKKIEQEEIECIVDALVPFIKSGFLPKEVELLNVKLSKAELNCLRRRIPQVYPVNQIPGLTQPIELCATIVT